MVGRATESGVKRVWYGLNVNSLVSGSAGEESISAFTETGAGRAAAPESLVPALGASDGRNPVDERYTDSPARGAVTTGAPAPVAAGVLVSTRRPAASNERVGGVARAWKGCRLSDRGLSSP